MVQTKFFLSIATAVATLVVHILPAEADAAKCEPDKLATKYPGLVGKTIRIGQDGESPPYSYRDPNNFNNLIGLDADMARAAFACIGVPVEFKTGAGRDFCRQLLPTSWTSCGTLSTTRPTAPSRSTS
jgi:polar amino acid transport system substrate-binding protein